MVWAIDLDDGTLIDALGDSIARPKEDVNNATTVLTCFGSGEFTEEL
jgi:chitinase